MEENKIWRPVVGFEKYYECCVDGRFKRLTRVYYNSLGKKITLKEKIVNGSYRNGYYHFNAVGDNKEHLDQGVHIFIAQSFPEICGEWFDGCEVHHKDGNKLNNNAHNLVVLTKQEHHRLHSKGESNPNYGNHNKKPNISKALKGQRRPWKHTPILQYTFDGTFVKEWECISDVFTELGYSAGNICMCCKGQLKQAYGYLWRYKNNGDSNEPPIS